MFSTRNLAATIGAVSALSLAAACGANETEPVPGGAAADRSDSGTESGETSPGSAADPAANLVGPGCADYAAAVPDGAGSVQGMAQDPVAVAAGNNPLLTTLVAAVSGKVNPRVNLVDTLNGDEFTVFAPVDEAFGEIPPKTLKALGKPANADTLSSILTYHVVPGRMTPDEVAGQTLTTVQGEDLKISGEGDRLRAQDADVICGGVQTANATVYLIDTVMMPPSTM
jgi:uncharacterized surface protein with fasciclin (FAS1) repeats